MGETFEQFLNLLKNNTTFAIIIGVSFVVIMFLSLAIIFYKIREKAWKALIPIYNIMALMSILGIPVWMVLVMFIPFVNIVGIPIMMIIMGWKLGSYCNKGILMKLGLCFLPPIFIIFLALCYIDIDGTSQYVLEPVKLPDDFSLDAVEVSDLGTNLMAMSLMETGVMEKIAPPMATRELEIPQTESVAKKEIKNIDFGATSTEVEDLNRVLPTADDLTFDYNTLYQGSVDAPKIVEEEKEEEQDENNATDFTLADSDASESTIDYDKLYTVEEKEKEENQDSEEKEIEKEVEEEVPEEVEEPTIVIHDVVLEAAEPVTEALGPIPINRRYDFQTSKKDNVKIEKQELEVPSTPSVEIPKVENVESVSVPMELASGINPLTPPVIAPVMSQTVEKVEDSNASSLPAQATSPFGDGELPSLAEVPDLTMPEVSEVQIEISDANSSEVSVQGLREQPVVESGTRVDQIVSMNIAEPSQLPVGILTRPPGVPEEPPAPIVEPEPEPEPVVPEPPKREMTRAEAMGISQTFFQNVVPNVSKNNVESAPIQPSNNIFNTGIPAIDNGQQPATLQTSTPTNVQQSQMNTPPADPTAIFQVNTSNGGSLLRPVESNLPPTEKTCPVCGVKLKPECPICIMCGYKF